MSDKKANDSPLDCPFCGGEIGTPAICYFDGQDTWHDSYGVDFTKILNKEDVLAWMPLPELCKGD